jgi:phage replication-related protein YjqB (UPF0714/DUF867 family)
MSRPAVGYRGYADAQSSVAVIAPHGGGIERYTSEIARAIAGDDFNFYVFEGVRRSGNYAALHLTSHRFDEPRCLELLSGCDHVVAIHGCGGDAQQALVGGLDTGLKAIVAQSIGALGVETLLADHPFPATDPMNICNRGRRGVGVQIEITMPLRLQGPRDGLSAAIRSVLLALPKHSCGRGSVQ